MEKPLRIVGKPDGWTPQGEGDHYALRPGAGPILIMPDLG